MVSRRKKIFSFAVTAAALLLLFLFAVNTGSLKVTPSELFKGLFIEYIENVATVSTCGFPAFSSRCSAVRQRLSPASCCRR